MDAVGCASDVQTVPRGHVPACPAWTGRLTVLSCVDSSVTQSTDSDPVQQRMDKLLDQCVQKALAILQEHGEFYPFGVTTTGDGRYTLVQARMEEERPTAVAVGTKLTAGLAHDAREKRFVTAAVVSDVQVRDPQTLLPSDAIRVHMEDREGEPLTFFLPYELVGGKITTRDILAEEGQAVIFGASPTGT